MLLPDRVRVSVGLCRRERVAAVSADRGRAPSSNYICGKIVRTREDSAMIIVASSAARGRRAPSSNGGRR